jgi:hypothetical protein
MKFDRRLLVSTERLPSHRSGGLFFSWRAWHWPGHIGTQCRLFHYKITIIFEATKEDSP